MKIFKAVLAGLALMIGLPSVLFGIAWAIVYYPDITGYTIMGVAFVFLFVWGFISTYGED